MTVLKFEKMTLPAADFPRTNPLSDLGRLGDLHSSQKKAPGMPEDVTINPDYGRPVSILPYTIQDDYDRDKQLRALDTAVLENDCLRATFVPALGGRLWSLFDKRENRELLYANPVFQPANLALRNAWFAGGIEWNISVIGHTPFTCSPLFVDTLETEFGPVLRMYEYERLRKAVYIMDFFMDERPFLFAHMTVINTTDKEIPMYWWTNMAVPEGKDVRVVVPADRALAFGGDGLSFRDIPYVYDTDASYTVNLDRAMDFFYYLEPGVRPFIAAADGAGKGFIQTSTKDLKGRKLFMWGQGAGGRRWQEYLARPGCAYLEIQAGLGRSQMEYLKMPPNGRYEWLEAFGPAALDPERLHGPWQGAQDAASEMLESALPRAEVDRLFEAYSYKAVRGAPVSFASPWGMLEDMRREKAGEEGLPKVLNFRLAPLTEGEGAWKSLVEGGGFGLADPATRPECYETAPEWRALLEKSAESADANNAAAWFYLAVMRYNDREVAGAKAAYEKSISLKFSAWAMRGLAVIEFRHGDKAAALELYKKACLAEPGERALAAEFGAFALESGQYEAFLELYPSLLPSAAKNPRILLIYTRCLIETGHLAEGEALLFGIDVADIREGEVVLSDLWYRVREKELIARGEAEGAELSARVRKELTPPAELDFRMS